MTRTLRSLAMLALASASIGWWNESPMAQSLTPSRSRIMIPFLANASKPDDLDFEGAECDVAGDRMTCAFQQVFLTSSPVAPDTCLVTTNRYEREFRRDSPSHWTSTEGPEGACGVLDVATLQDAGGVRWTMELTKVVTNTGRRSSVSERRRQARDLQLAKHPSPAALQERSTRRSHSVAPGACPVTASP